MSTFRACPWKSYLEYFEHYKPKPQSIHLHAGKCFASALERARLEFYQYAQSADAAVALGVETLRREWGDVVPPEGVAKSLDRMIGALVYYFEHYPLATDSARPFKMPGSDKWTIEFSFAEPLGVDHPETGEPLILAGRADQIVHYAGGTYIEDDKTASQLGASWAKQWDLRSQFTHYAWAAERMGIRVDGVLIRGVSILKTKYDTAESVTYRPQWQIERGIAQLERDLLRMIDAWKSGAWDMNLDHSCSDFGGCGYRQICLVQDQQPFLDAAFERRRWDPITREETVL